LNFKMIKIFESHSLFVFFQNICWHVLGFQNSFTKPEMGLHTHTRISNSVIFWKTSFT
jgi:hypothetical protein